MAKIILYKIHYQFYLIFNNPSYLHFVFCAYKVVTYSQSNGGITSIVIYFFIVLSMSAPDLLPSEYAHVKKMVNCFSNSH